MKTALMREGEELGEGARGRGLPQQASLAPTHKPCLLVGLFSVLETTVVSEKVQECHRVSLRWREPVEPTQTEPLALGPGCQDAN